MQGHDWNDLRFALALHRAGTLAGAGRALGVAETTVARRVAALEAALGTALFRRDGRGAQIATEAGSAVLDRAEIMETQDIALAEAARSAQAGLRGSLRISAVPMVAHRLLAPRIGAFLKAHPGLDVELAAEAQNADLIRRQADLALRFARPAGGGVALLARKLGTISFALYGPAQGDCDAWVLYEAQHAHLPQAKWLARAAFAGNVALRVADVETAREAVAAGLGRSLLPGFLAAGDLRLRLLEAEHALPSRELWLLSHADDTRAAVCAMKDWLTGLDWMF